MLRLIALAFLISGSVYAQIPVNNTILDACASKLIHCTNYNQTYNASVNASNYCVDSYRTCIQEAPINLRLPLTCYQTRAAKTNLKTTFIVTTVIMGVTLIAIPISSGLIPYLASKCSCCAEAGMHTTLKEAVTGAKGTGDGTAIAIQPPDPTTDPGKFITSKMLASLSVAFGSIVNFATFTSLYSAYQAWTVASAACCYDQYASPERVGDLTEGCQ